MPKKWSDDPANRTRSRRCGKGAQAPRPCPLPSCGSNEWVSDMPKDQTMPGLGMKGTRLGRRAPGSFEGGKRGR